MQYLFLSLILIALIVVALNFFRGRKRKKILEELRAGWGKEKDSYADLDRLSLFTSMLGNGAAAKRLGDDLDLEKVFAKINRCHTAIGKQFLFHLLTSPFDRKAFAERMALIGLFDGNRDVREKVQLILTTLKSSFALPRIFLGTLEPLKMPAVYRLMALLPVILFVAALTAKVLWFAFAGSLAANLLIHYSNKKNIRAYLDPVLELIALRKCARRLTAVAPALKDDAAAKACDQLGGLNKFRFILSSDMSEPDDLSAIFWVLVEYIKIALLIEVLALEQCSKALIRLSAPAETLFRYTGNIDACISASSYRASLPLYAQPTLTDSTATAQLTMEAVVHPLLADCVPNNVRLTASGMVITGSNMSGKTSYIKTIGVNVLLAQSIGTVLAKSYTASVFRVATSVKTEDSISESRSYYLTEVLAIKALLDSLADSSACHLFIIDELFKGTNTVERIAAARAVLLHLQQQNSIVLVSTHDLELAHELAGAYSLHHFTDAIRGDDLIFDHVIRDGPLQSRNAIRLLGMMKYPPEVVAAAEDFVNNPPKPSK